MKTTTIKFVIFLFCLTVLSFLALFPDFFDLKFDEKKPVSPTPIVETKQLTSKQLLEKIRSTAQFDVNKDLPLKDTVAIKEEFGPDLEKVGLTIDKAYTEYSQQYEKSLSWKLFWSSRFPWITTLGLIIFVAFQKFLQEKFTQLLKFMEKVLTKYFSHLFFRIVYLKNYRKNLYEKIKSVKNVFDPENQISLTKYYVNTSLISRNRDRVDGLKAVKENQKLMLHGAPGAGKSIFLKNLALYYLEDDRCIPILIELRKYNNFQGGLDKLMLAVIEENTNKPVSSKTFIDNYLKIGNAIILLDGLDEISSDLRASAINEVKILLDKYKKCKVVITCRTAIYKEEFFDVVDKTYQVAEFNDSQIQSFLNNFTGDIPKGKSIPQLIESLQDRPRILSIARSPLLLSIIVLLYKTPGFILPHSRTEFYEYAVNIILIYWNRSNNEFDPNRKRIILEKLALFNQKKNRPQFDNNDFKSIKYEVVIQETADYLKDLNFSSQNAEAIIREIIDRSGLLIEIDNGKQIQFAHLTLQEYFAATALKNSSERLLEEYNSNPTAWRESIKLWCGLDVDSTQIVSKIFQDDKEMALELVVDAKNLDSEIALKIISEAISNIGKSNEMDLSFSMLISDQDNDRGKFVFEFLKRQLKEDINTERIVDIFSNSNHPKAANLLARNYDNELYREALLNMGNVAIAELLSITSTENIEKIVDDLYKINTPLSAIALVMFLNGEDNHTSTVKSAYYLSEFLIKNEVEELLSKMDAENGIGKERMGIDWLWAPFFNEKKNEKNQIKRIVGRMSYIIANSVPPAMTIKRIDPRIAVPLLLVQSNNSGLKVSNKRELRSEAKKSAFMEDVIKNGNIRQSTSPFGFNSKSLIHVFKLIEEDTRNQVIDRLANYRDGEIQDWLRVRNPTKYDYSKSWHYWSILSLIFSFPLVLIILVLISNPNDKNIIFNGGIILLFQFPISYFIGKVIARNIHSIFTFQDLNLKKELMFFMLLGMPLHGFSILIITTIILIASKYILNLILFGWLLISCIVIWIIYLKSVQKIRISQNPMYGIIKFEKNVFDHEVV